MDEQEMIDAVLEWAESHPSFDTEFVESLQDWLGDNGALTISQSDALENIINKFRIEV